MSAIRVELDEEKEAGLNNLRSPFRGALEESVLSLKKPD